VSIDETYTPDARAVIFAGDCSRLLGTIPDGAAQLVVTSPPYNLGKEYETRRGLDEYVADQTSVITECIRVLGPSGSLCWQVGNHVTDGAIVPLDIILYPVFAAAGLVLRNRVIWHFEHGLHCSRRLSGRYETILWFTKSDQYVFNLDPIRVPQKYPGKKQYKGPRAGEYSCNPLGKNPGDVWLIPNVKCNHVEKTEHPCQFPVELIERLVLALTDSDDLVLDPYLGTGTTAIAAIRHGRRAIGAEIVPRYVELARARVSQEMLGRLRTRPMHRPVYDPANAGRSLTTAPWLRSEAEASLFADVPADGP
jgi:adenine-specific DNA-methyltransferase